MAERAKLKIKGIYSTALSDIFLERGFTIVAPSAVISERFALAPVPDEEEVTIYDRSGSCPFANSPFRVGIPRVTHS